MLLLALVRTTRAKVRSDRPSAYDTTAGRLRVVPPDTGALALTDDLHLSLASEFQLHVRLCPLLREIASYRLRARYGVDLTAEPQRARDLVGEPVWELIDPRRPKPKDRLARGPSLVHLREVIAALESLEMLTVQEVAERANRILEEVERAVVGKRDALALVLLAFLADGHVLIEDFPGLAKTLTARSFAQVLDIEFSRIQFTPDLMPSDVTGSSIYNQRSSDFEFRRGPIFTNLLLGDEINRAPPKTQAALLEAMQERQVTIEGETIRLNAPFLVIATQNPIEYEGTYPLPEAQLDRFLLRVNFGYPSRDDEWTLLERRLERATDEIQLDAVIDRPGLVEMQEAIEQVDVTEPIGRYVVDVVTGTRTSQRVQVGASPRGSLALLKLSRCRAVLEGRDFVTPEDVKAVAGPALSHRLMLRPELWVQRIRPEDVVREVLETVPTPAAEGLPAR